MEALIERFLRTRCPSGAGDLRSLVESQVARVTIRASSIDLELQESKAAEGEEEGDPPRQVVSLPWSKKPLRAAKGVVFAPGAHGIAQEEYPRRREAILVAINKARRWMGELLSGRRLTEIAQEEGYTIRHAQTLVQLAFVSPRLIKAIMHENVPPGMTATSLCERMSPLWSLQEQQHFGFAAPISVGEQCHAGDRLSSIANPTAI